MKKIIIFILLIGISFKVLSQDSVSGRIYDAITKEPIQYANVGVINSGLGTVTDEKGEFIIRLKNDISTEDTLRISMIGYEGQDFLLRVINSQGKEFYLTPLTFEIKEVIVKPNKTYRVGNDSKSKILTVYFSKANSLGAELGTRVKIKRDLCHVSAFGFNIVRNDFDSLTLRLNIYSVSNDKPTMNLLNEKIIFNISQSEGLFKLDLNDYAITIRDDIIVTLEILELFGDENAKFIIPGALGGSSYFRFASQDKWNKIKKIKLGFYLITQCE